MSARHIVIACGGTGGHLSPGIALAERLQEEGHRVTLLISHKKVDTRLVEKYPQLRFRRVPGVGLTASPLGLARFVVSQTRGLGESLALLARERVDAVVGFGGFTTSTIIVAAALRRVPVFLHEANRVPGKAIRLLRVLARRVYLPPGVRLEGAKAEQQAAMALPVRREIQAQPVAEARARWGLRIDRPVVTLLGGSQGASALNEWARRHQADWLRLGVQVVLVTGLGKGADQRLEQPSAFGPLPWVELTFCDQMAALFSASDFVVTRAGAGTLAEMARCGTPGLLVPFPHAADNHQQANAEYFAERGGGEVLDQTKLDQLWGRVECWLAEPEALAQRRLALRRLAAEHHLEIMVRDLRRAWEFGS